jgi:outer membrane protein assembly factor BamB
MMVRIFSVLLFVTASSTFLSAQDFESAKYDNWHQWRGPDANGAAKNADPPLKWDEKTNVRWKVELPGKGSSTPVVWGDRVFVLSAEKTDRVAKAGELPKREPSKRTPPLPNNFYKFRVHCFDRATGKVLWERLATERVPYEGHHTSHTYAAGSPTTDGKLLYVSFGSMGNYCYDLDGNLKWSRELGVLNTRLGWGEAVSPVAHGNSLLLNYDQEANSKLYCLETETGKDRWVATRDEKTTWSTPLVTEFGGKTQVVTNGTTEIRSYDLASGDLIWTCEGMTVNPIPSPLRFGDSVICVSGYRGAAAVSIPLSSKGDLGKDGKVNWRYSSGMPYVPSAALVGDRLYCTERNENLLTVLDAKTGKVVIDRERLPQARTFYASPIFADGRVYFTDQRGTTLVLRPGNTIDVLATNSLDDAFDASPVAVGKQLFLRGHHYLYCIEEK